MAGIALTIVGKPDCHLCETASEIVDVAIAELPDAIAESISIDEVSILDDKVLHDNFWEKIPVVLINGTVHSYWRVNAAELQRALTDAATAAGIEY